MESGSLSVATGLPDVKDRGASHPLRSHSCDGQRGVLSVERSAPTASEKAHCAAAATNDEVYAWNARHGEAVNTASKACALQISYENSALESLQLKVTHWGGWNPTRPSAAALRSVSGGAEPRDFGGERRIGVGSSASRPSRRIR